MPLPQRGHHDLIAQCGSAPDEEDLGSSPNEITMRKPRSRVLSDCAEG